MKRAQISLFMIIGLIIVIAGAILVYMVDTPKIEELKEIDENPIVEMTQQCMNDVAYDAINIVGHFGGGYISNSDSLSDISLHLEEGVILSPDQLVVGENFAKIIDETLLSCLNGYKSFWQIGQRVLPLESYTQVVVSNNALIIKTIMKTSIEEDGANKEISSFNSELSYSFGKYYKIVTDIVAHHKERGMFDITYIENLAQENKFDYEIFPYEGYQIMSFKFTKDIRPLLINVRVKLNEEI